MTGIADRATSGASDEASGGWDLLLDFDPRRGRMRRSLGDALRAGIQDGRLASGTVLPASRRLAADLAVSRGVVSDAYDQLTCEGYLKVVPRCAPVVAQVAAMSGPVPEPPAVSWRFDFTATTPDVTLFPRSAWSRAVNRAARAAADAALDYGDHRGRIELRTALSGYLARVRGVRVDPAHLVITQGFTQALDLLCHVLAARGRAVLAMESPSHPGLWVTVRQAGLRLVGCPVDTNGLQTAWLSDLGVDAVVVAPAHQFPTGAVLAPARRSALVDWAVTHDGLVIEDDYDAEFRYERAPVGAIQGLDPARVAHVGTASKTLAPGVRLGWISAPAELVDELRERKSAADSGSPALDQLALAGLLTSGEYDHHIRHARHVYCRRRDLLCQAITAAYPDADVTGAAAGMQLLLPLPERVDDVALAQAAATQGINVEPLSPLHLAPSPQRGLLLGYGRLPEHRIPPAIHALAAILHDVRVTPSRPD